MRLFPSLRAEDVWRACAAVAATSLLASLWPALRAARLQPVEAMRA
jgi:ABC-type lipoprotein release transport system permease subunit